jgi:hypothetical protein
VGACTDNSPNIQVYTWEDDIDELLKDHGNFVALIHYQGDTAGYPKDIGIEEIAKWLHKNEIFCYYYRPEPTTEGTSLDALMIPFSKAGLSIRERFQHAIQEGEFTREALAILEEKFSLP